MVEPGVWCSVNVQVPWTPLLFAPCAIGLIASAATPSVAPSTANVCLSGLLTPPPGLVSPETMRPFIKSRVCA